MKEVTAKSPAERVPLTFDFSDQLAEGESVTGSPVITVRAVRGLDSTPASRLSGPATIADGSVVQQLFQGGLLHELYEVHCVASTNNSQTLELVQLLPVRDPADT